MTTNPFDRANRVGPGCSTVLGILFAVLVALLILGIVWRLLLLLPLVILGLIVLAIFHYRYRDHAGRKF